MDYKHIVVFCPPTVPWIWWKYVAFLRLQQLFLVQSGGTGNESLLPRLLPLPAVISLGKVESECTEDISYVLSL